MRFKIMLVLAALGGMAAGYFAWYWIVRTPASPRLHASVPSPRPAPLGVPRPDFSLPDLDGNVHNVREWDGAVLVLNFWATWCAPCVKEIPMLAGIDREYRAKGLQLIGIALDRAAPVRAFVHRFGVGYPVLLGEQEAIEVGRAYGNRVGALPFTAVVDRHGKIVFRKFGILVRDDFVKLIRKLLRPVLAPRVEGARAAVRVLPIQHLEPVMRRLRKGGRARVARSGSAGPGAARPVPDLSRTGGDHVLISLLPRRIDAFPLSLRRVEKWPRSESCTART